MSIHVVQTIENLITLRDAWDNLTSQPLLSFDWNYQWWKSFANIGSLQVYYYKADGEVVGIAPFFTDNWLGQKRLRLLGSGATATDYTQIIVKPEYQSAFAAAIATEIEQFDNIKLLELEGIRGTTNDHLICEQLADSFWRYDKQLEPAWVLDLPNNWDDFLKSANSSLRRKIRKASKRLDRGEVQVLSTRKELDFEHGFDVLVELHQQRLNSKGHLGVFDNSEFTNFLKAAAKSLCEKQKAEILVGEFEGSPFVAQFYLLGDSGPQFYQSGFRIDCLHLEPGHLLFTFAVRQAIESGCKQFDFLRGHESYKSFWGASPVPLYTVRCVSNQLVSTVPHQILRYLRKIKRDIQSIRSTLKPFGATS